MSSKRILVTGGAGYIGAHVARLLLRAGHHVDVIDNLSTGDPAAIDALARIGGSRFRFQRCDVRNEDDLDRAVALAAPDVIVHLAGLKDVAQSYLDTATYYAVNVSGTANLLASAHRTGVSRFVFSSSAAVYGEPGAQPVRECDPARPASPYGKTKLMGESLVRRWAEHAPGARRAIALRYFNPCGRHPDLQPEHAAGDGRVLSLADAVRSVAAGERPHLTIFGGDHPTPDGTCRRDFVHIADIAEAHVRAVHRDARDLAAFEPLNIGSGTAHSVLEFLAEFRRVSGIAIPYRVGASRRGDGATSCADISLARERLNWRPVKGMKEICRDLAARGPLRPARPRSVDAGLVSSGVAR